MKRNNNSSYKTDLDNQQVAAYPSNRNLRIKSDFVKPSQKQSKQNYQSTNIKNQPYRNNRVQHSVQPKRYKTYQFPSIQEQQETKINRKKIKNSYITIPYDTEQVNRNVSKVLSDIQEIQSEFRKLSNQNSLILKEQKYSQQQYQNEETKSKMNTFLGSLMDKIKKPVNYQQKTDDYIKKQKTQLVSLVKNLNKKLNQRLKEVQKDQQKSNTRQSINSSKLQGRRRIKTEVEEQQARKNQLIPSALQFQKSLVQVFEQVNTNQKLIENMRHQLQFLNKKYQGYQNSLKNYKSTQHTVDELKSMIKKKKQEISRLRKKKFLTQKSIISIQKRNGNLFAFNSTDILSTNCSTSTHPNDSLSSLKQQYSEYLKKRDKMKNKLQMNKMHLNRIQELKEKNNVNKQHYEELVEEIKRLNYIKEEEYEDEEEYNKRYNKLSRSKSLKTSKRLSQAQLQHLQFMYKTKRSKLQMLLNTIKRNDQSYKRKYYKLLKQYESIVKVHSDSATSSPSKALSRSKVFKDHFEIVDEKLYKAKENILELENKIQRLGKVGKIVKKVNIDAYKNEDESQDDEQYQQANDDEYNMTQQSQSEKLMNNNSSNMYDKSFMKKDDSNSKSQTTPLNHHLNYQSNINNHKNRPNVITASSFIKTPHSELSLKEHHPYRFDRQSQFLTQNDKSFHQSTFGNDTSTFGIDTSRLLSYNNLNSQQKKKYIGKFKKQRIVEKYSKMNDTNNIGNNNEEKFSPLLIRKHNKQDDKKKPSLTKNDVKQTIIEQQIQATNSLDSSQYKYQGSNSNKQYQYNKSQWDQKILSLLKDNDENEDIEQDIQQTNSDNNKNSGQQEDYGSSEFSPQKQSEMLLLKHQTQREQKETEIKQKYSNILYKSRVFN